MSSDNSMVYLNKDDLFVADKFSDKEVVSWLSKNKDFFIKNPEVLNFLEFEAEIEEYKIVDFKHYALSLATKEVELLRHKLKDLLSVAQENLDIQTGIFNAALGVLEANNLIDLLKVIKNDWVSLLKVDYINILAEPLDEYINSEEVVGGLDSGLGLVEFGSCNALFAEATVRMIPSFSQGGFLFGQEGGNKVSSCLLARLDIGGIWGEGILALGKIEKNSFNENMAIDNVLFLLRVLEICLKKFLN